ncbi:MAG: RNA polymerase sigma factor [Ruminococcus sp.]|nr:RNA polymerase sigma factor [Ruminococcus sp.]
MDNGTSFYNRFLDGDKKSFTELVKEYWDGLTLYLTGFVENFSEAEEIAEETFLKLYVDKPRFSEKSLFKTWLYSVGRNTALYYLRKKKKIKESNLENFYDISDKNDIESNYIKEENKKLLHSIMKKLNTDYRQVLYLVYFENFSNNETAEIMLKNERQIRNLLYRAKCALKVLLEKEGFVYEEL